ncbi:MAG: glycosyltransferase family 1 protein [Clostridiales bacterium]|nr:glycosyltransferase family 1 protein [Clostridiales bacterium]
MRILEAFGEPISYGGQEAFVLNVLRKMDMTGIEADFLTPYYCDNPAAEDFAKEHSGTVYSLGCDFRPGSLRSGERKHIERFLKTHRYDIIHIHSGSNSMLAMYARLAHRAGIPGIIVHSHCTGRRGWKHTLSKAATAFSLSAYPTDYCACSEDAGKWRFPARICRDRLIVIKNGIEVDRFRYDASMREAVRGKLGIGDEDVLIGNVGRLTGQKNQSALIDILAEIRSREKNGTIGKDRRGEYRLILIGDGEDREMLEKKAEILKVGDSVLFTGAVDNVADYLQAIDVAAMPSRYEGLAIAAIEAQAAGLEVYASHAIPELAAVTPHLKFLPADDVNAWAEALASPHRRHPEGADLAEKNGFGSGEAAATVRRIYMQYGRR